MKTALTLAILLSIAAFTPAAADTIINPDHDGRPDVGRPDGRRVTGFQACENCETPRRPERNHPRKHGGIIACKDYPTNHPPGGKGKSKGDKGGKSKGGNQGKGKRR
jgi:hypothetical protein